MAFIIHTFYPIYTIIFLYYFMAYKILFFWQYLWPTLLMGSPLQWNHFFWLLGFIFFMLFKTHFLQGIQEALARWHLGLTVLLVIKTNFFWYLSALWSIICWYARERHESILLSLSDGLNSSIDLSVSHSRRTTNFMILSKMPYKFLILAKIPYKFMILAKMLYNFMILWKMLYKFMIWVKMPYKFKSYQKWRINSWSYQRCCINSWPYQNTKEDSRIAGAKCLYNERKYIYALHLKSATKCFSVYFILFFFISRDNILFVLESMSTSK